MKRAIFCIVAGAVLTFLLWPHQPHPTPDELYGCTVAQQAPNGECK